jgi:hypothetical protein
MAPESSLPPHLSREDSAAIGRRRRGRNIAMLIVLIAIAVLFYAIAVVKLAKPGLGGL